MAALFDRFASFSTEGSAGMRRRSVLSIRLIAVGTMLALTMAASVAGATGSLAQPAVQSTTCSLKANLTFDPGLLFAERQQVITAKGRLSGCIGSGVLSARFKGTGGGDLGCTSGTGSATIKVKWNTGEKSKVSLTLDIGSQTFSGKVTGGKFKGESVTATNISFQPGSGDCIFTPITTAK